MVCLGRRPCLADSGSRAKSALPGSRVSATVRSPRYPLLAARRVSRGGPADSKRRKVERRPGRAHPWTLRCKWTIDDRLAVVPAMDHLPAASARRRWTWWRKQFRAGRDRCIEQVRVLVRTCRSGAIALGDTFQAVLLQQLQGGDDQRVNTVSD